MPRYQFAIFNFDGTLADSFSWFCSIVNQTADKFGFSRVDDSEVEALRDLGVRAIIAHLVIPV
ncbi:MAG: HAD hydrolase-like protein [Candidatus Devosia symbiotica]|nr:HAD hydrolase-like protein [Candidatus Devosia symbiotica]